MATKRRYKTTENPAYDLELNSGRRNSRILNGGNFRPGIDTIIWSKRMAEGLLLELRGDESGKYMKNGTWEIADIPNCQKKLDNLEKRFADYQQDRINKGYAKPKDWPTDLMNEKFVLEAKMDLMLEEAEFCEDQIKKVTVDEDNKMLAKMLPHGPLGHGGLSGGIIRWMDGQRVDTVKGTLVISEKQSPYYGVSVTDYRDNISWPWCEANLTIDREKHAIRERMSQRQGVRDSRLIEEECSKLRTDLLNEHPEWQKLFALQLPNRPPMPTVPEGITIYLTK